MIYSLKMFAYVSSIISFFSRKSETSGPASIPPLTLSIYFLKSE